jgi:histidyl-tRNA synthetase
MLQNTTAFWQIKELEKPFVTASYFGFTPISAPRINEVDLTAVSHCAEHQYFDAAEKAALIRNYVEHDFASLPHPLALIYKKPAAKKRLGGYSLHYIGTPSGIAEASIIRAALSILLEEGYKNLRIDLNCTGDKESLAIYERELHNFVRKFGQDISGELRELLKQDIFNLFRDQSEEAMAFRSTAPSAVSFLSSSARSHFKEVLEFVEALGVEFNLAPELIGEKNHASHTIFGIRATGEDAEDLLSGDRYLAVGYRYSRLTRKLGMKKEIPMAGATIFSRPEALLQKKIYKDLPRSKFYLVQLGHEAKAKTLTLLEDLRAHHIRVHHFLGKDKLSVQLQGAETLRVPYLIIIGHKEALDGTATVRNVTTRAQDTIPLSLLPQYLKKISL